MIPTIISQQVKQGILDFLSATFPVQDPVFGPMLEEFIHQHETLFKGPYISLRLPFSRGTIGEQFFPDVPTGFIPYLHQQKAFVRLQESAAQSTLIATGTGSGKTECFLYPILDYCYHHRGEPGIKAVVIYPMNALANDQASRFAETIYNNQNLKGNVSVGLYIGGTSSNTVSTLMTRDQVITDKALLREVPPDILLTNYKMLDLLMIREQDSSIWNTNATETLKYLVVDELHTFDGAQGTDLACLIRRLKHRLGTPANHLCAIGTSATIGGEEDTEQLRSYASSMFQEAFDADSIITEENITPALFLQDEEILYEGITSTDTAVPDITRYSDPESYITAQAQLWFGMKVKNPFSPAWRKQLAGFLSHHDIFQQFLLQIGQSIVTAEEITAVLAGITGQAADTPYIHNLAVSLLSLITWARDPGQKTDEPFLHVRSQLWMRELRRLVAEVSLTPHVAFADDLSRTDQVQYLPVVYCNECGATGWGAVRRETEYHYSSDLERFYNAFFGKSKDTYIIYPQDTGRGEHVSEDNMQLLCPNCLSIEPFQGSSQCAACGHEQLLSVYIHNPRITVQDRTYGTHDCTYCGGHNSLTITGRRSSSLISVALSQLFTSAFNDDKKVLTFSDSVQDASHRAGFFSARTWQFNFRTALMQFLLKSKASPSLADAPKQFSDWWSAVWEPAGLPEKYIATFIPPDMEWLQEFKKFQREGITGSTQDLRRLIDERLSWEITSEFGFNSLIGRTLEKTASAVAAVPSEHINTAAERIKERVSEEIGGVSIPLAALCQYIEGLLISMRQKGAVDHPALKRYIETSCKDGFLFSHKSRNELFMPRLGTKSRLPKFYRITGYGLHMTNLLSRGNSPVWNQEWMRKTLAPHDAGVIAYEEQAVQIILKVLQQQELLSVHYGKQNEEIFGINPHVLMITTDTVRLRCPVCAHTVTIPKQNQKYWLEMPCQRRGCSGSYELTESQDAYYRQLYRTGDIERIFSREHTGLLKREVREEIEHQFIHHIRPTNPNVLSCTPTLEMGINIGDLSSAILCSVPPSQAQYLQRIGRTGRKDGNSFILTVAEGKPHDQFFYAQPYDMINGTVPAPYIYLNAPAVLERQFVAFCFDTWIRIPGEEVRVPLRMEKILSTIDHQNEDTFPFNFFSFIRVQRNTLLEDFIALFADDLDEYAESYLRNFILGNDSDIRSIEDKLLNTIHKLKIDQDGLTARWKQYGTAVKEMKKKAGKGDKNYEDDLQHLIQERSALHSFIKRNKKKLTYNFLTDEGFLPNYTFPEAGVLLRSLILHRKSVPDGRGRYRRETFEYERPARSAIRELAPDSIFYAEGRKVRIDQIDVTASEVTEWRLCDKCSYAVPEATLEAVKTCPRCGSPMWADSARSRAMIRLSQVYATTPDRESRTFDETETREPVFYNQHVLVDINQNNILDSWKIEHDQLPFGFEFIRQTTFREINFGPVNSFRNVMEIDGKEIEVPGFTVCKECGKVQNSRDETPQHAVTCSHYRAHTPPPPEAYYEGIFLFREFFSESIRILLPVTALTDERSIESLVASLFLGLKKKFGNIDHISSTITSSPSSSGGDRRSYLILYDTVPGGTGYLKQLMKKPEEMIDVLQLALDTMKNCSCNQTDRDGCYRCLLAYRRSRKQNLISRSLAVELISNLLGKKTRIEHIRSLDDISFSKLYDSELELKFIDTLRGSKAPVSGSPVKLQKYLHTPGGNPGWIAEVGNHQYIIEPQVPLGASAGLQHPSKPDFIMYPKIQGANSENRMLPIAVFTDGYEYHKNSIDQDTAKRMDIVQTHQYRIWSLTWDDLEEKKDMLLYDAQRQSVYQALDTLGADRPDYFLGKNSFELLLLLLENYSLTAWQQFAAAMAMMFTKPKALEKKDFSSLLHLWQSYDLQEEYEHINGSGAGSGEAVHTVGGIPVLSHIGFFPITSGSFPEFSKFYTYLLFSDKESETVQFDERKRLWNGFLNIYNILQFLPNTKFLSTSGLKKGLYWGIAFEDAGYVLPAEGDSAELFDLTDHLYDAELTELIQAGKPLPEPFFELQGSKGECIAQAVMAWVEEKTAVVPSGEEQPWRSAGWFATAEETFRQNLSEIKERI